MSTSVLAQRVRLDAETCADGTLVVLDEWRGDVRRLEVRHERPGVKFSRFYETDWDAQMAFTKVRDGLARLETITA